MEHKVYQTTRISFSEYEFFSEGPRGRIRKRIRFSKNMQHDDMFNLGLLDVDLLGTRSDTTISNNADINIIFNTIIVTVRNFFEDIPGKYVVFSGNTPARTRLFRIALSNNLNRLKDEFLIFGLSDGAWRPFDSTKTYLAFLVESKNT